MKIGIKIEGLSLTEAQDVLAKLSGSTATITTSGTPPTIPQFTSTSDEDDNSAPAGDVTGEYDKEGLLWDARIHSSSKKKTAAGVWVRRKGLTEETYQSIKTEIRNAGSVTAPQHPLPPQMMQTPAPAAMQMPASFAATTHLTPQPIQQAPAAVPQMPPQQVQTPAPVQDINSLFAKIQSVFAAGQADANWMPSLLARLSQQFGVQVAGGERAFVDVQHVRDCRAVSAEDRAQREQAHVAQAKALIEQLKKQ